MDNILTKTQAEILKKGKVNPKVSNVGEIHPFIFEVDSEFDFSQDLRTIKVGIMYLGTYLLDAEMFPVFECPVCRKKELLPYACTASFISSLNTIKGECKACGEHVAFCDFDYYCLLRDYILKNKDKVKRVKDRQCVILGQSINVKAGK